MNRRLLALALVAGMGMAVAPAAEAQQSVSAGCQETNDPKYDGMYNRMSSDFQQYVAGDRITVAAGLPTTSGEPAEAVALYSSRDEVDSDIFPGTLEYTIPTTGWHAISWSTANLVASEEDGVTWVVSCTPAPTPTSKDQCLGDGWETFGMFANSGECMRYVAAGGKKPPAS